ncbi:MAG: hypothetical protein COA63_009395 [Methylophaga sp.]|nr:hypothetical protein [Methylophaga sp.]
MMKTILILVSSIAILFSFPTLASVIDFQQLERNQDGPFRVAVGSNKYIEDGFQLDYLGSRPWDGFYSLGTLDSRYTGSTAMFNNTPGGTTQLSKVGGGIFDLFSIDLAKIDGTSFGNVTFTRDGGHSQTFVSSSLSITETFLFDAGFLGARSVSWIQTSSFLGFHQFDNININVSSVPIPAAAFMFAPALLGFLGLRRKAKITTV